MSWQIGWSQTWQEGQDWVRVCVSFLSDPQERNFSPHHRVTFSFFTVKKAAASGVGGKGERVMGEGEWKGGTVSFRGGKQIGASGKAKAVESYSVLRRSGSEFLWGWRGKVGTCCEGGTGSQAKEVAQTNLRTILSFPCTTPPFSICCIFAYTHFSNAWNSM